MHATMISASDLKVRNIHPASKKSRLFLKASAQISPGGLSLGGLR
jgi:hypothetical protein